MRKIFLFIVIVSICGCNHEKKALPVYKSDAKGGMDSAFKGYTLTTRFNSFDTTIEVLFTDTKKSISEIQKKNYEGFIARQDLLAPQILQKIFDYYKNAYPDYKKGWTMAGGISDVELEKYLPVPTTPENLKPFITPAIVYIQSKKNCKEGAIGIEFDCTLDIENGLGVAIGIGKLRM